MKPAPCTVVALVMALMASPSQAQEVHEASIECRQVGPISFKEPLPQQEGVFTERMSLLFKRLHVVRMVDVQRNTLIYLTYSGRVIQ